MIEVYERYLYYNGMDVLLGADLEALGIEIELEPVLSGIDELAERLVRMTDDREVRGVIRGAESYQAPSDLLYEDKII